VNARVIVVGAGPAGCSAAIALRRAGFEVLLVDKDGSGRDKVCGDALIPDAFAALEEVGCLEAVLARAHAVPCLRIHAPGYTPVDVRGRLACIPRAQLDTVLLAKAQELGAEFLPEMTLVGLLESGGRVTGVRLHPRGRYRLQLSADYVLLATGAASGPLEAAGMCLRRSPSGVALRAYYELPASLAEELDVFTLHYDRRSCPAYGWIFAGPDRVFNIGVSQFHDAPLRRRKSNLRELWEGFMASCPAAAQIHKYARQLAPQNGAPLRTSLAGARITRPGLMLVGETIGTTYALSGEGIGKAMQSGLLAAECLARDPTQAEAAYEQQLQARYRTQYDAYRVAQSWLSFPSVCRLLAKRAGRGTYVRSQLEGILAETVNPRELVSVRGMMRAMVA
jgi:geranylgeranyl reductase family protein